MIPQLPANRAAAIAGVGTSLAATIAGLVQVLPSSWANYALAASGLLLQAVTIFKFLEGSQRWEASPAGQAQALAAAAAPVQVAKTTTTMTTGGNSVTEDQPTDVVPPGLPDDAPNPEIGPEADEPAEPEAINETGWMAARDPTNLPKEKGE